MKKLIFILLLSITFINCERLLEGVDIHEITYEINTMDGYDIICSIEDNKWYKAFHKAGWQFNWTKRYNANSGDEVLLILMARGEDSATYYIEAKIYDNHALVGNYLITKGYRNEFKYQIP